MGVEKIFEIVESSKIASYHWKGRGVAPIGYMKGMALIYARACCKLKLGDAAVVEMSKAQTGDKNTDALAWYSETFDSLNMSNDQDGVKTLRHLFVLLIGLGMRESSGRYCEGRDRSAFNTTAETAEAGLFQTSFNARHGNPLLKQLFASYSTNSSGFLEIFKEGVRCRSLDLENFGRGKGRTFQLLSKECPAFAAEFAALGLRSIRTHWGPINRRAAEILPDCEIMLEKVEKTIDVVNLCPDLI